MEIRELRVFVEVCRDLNFTITANRLFMTQQNISNYIKKLEADYSVKLFERRPRLRLTAAGAELLAFANTVMAQEQSLRKRLSDCDGQDRGILRIGASLPRARYILPQVLEGFSKEYPNVRFQIVDSPSSKLENMVERGELDLAIGVFNGQIRGGMLRELYREPLFMCVSGCLLERELAMDCARAARRDAAFGDISGLAELPVIMPLRGSALTERISAIYRELNIKPRVYMYAEYPQFFAPICKMGLAAGFFLGNGLSSVEGSGPLEIYPVFQGGEQVGESVSLLTSGDRRGTRFQERFIRILLEWGKRQERALAAKFSNRGPYVETE